MFEHSKQHVTSGKRFANRLSKAFLLSFSMLVIWLAAGVLGYHFIAHLSWVDSFHNASMIIGGMGPVDIMQDNASKIFAGFYAIFSGVVFLVGIAVLAAPIIHRFIHKFHLDVRE